MVFGGNRRRMAPLVPFLALGVVLAPPSIGVRRRGDAIARATSLRMALDDAEREEKLRALYEGTQVQLEVDKSEPSHKHLEVDEDGDPYVVRMTYVDEHECIGCTYCASIARSTFFMEDDFGRARVFQQGGDSDDVIEEAVASCPVNCIHFVSHSDLVILENERDGQTINFQAKLVGGDGDRDRSPSAAKAFNMGGSKCGNCPQRGCKDCPMYGVGDNPVFKRKAKEREAKRQAKREAAAAASQPDPLAALTPKSKLEEERISGALDVLFTEDDAVLEESLTELAVSGVGGFAPAERVPGPVDAAAVTASAVDDAAAAAAGGDGGTEQEVEEVVQITLAGEGEETVQVALDGGLPLSDKPKIDEAALWKALYDEPELE